MKNEISFGMIGSALIALAAVGCNSVKDAQQDASTPDIEHNWQQNKCDSVGSLKLIGASVRTTYAFAGANVSKTVQIYSAADCVDPSISISYSGGFATRDTTAPNVRPIDFSYGTAVVTAQNDAGLKALNDVNFCGNATWVVNTPVDLSAKTRDASCPLPALPEAGFDIYSVVNGTLFFGQGGDASDADHRPTAIDSDSGYSQL